MTFLIAGLMDQDITFRFDLNQVNLLYAAVTKFKAGVSRSVVQRCWTDRPFFVEIGNSLGLDDAGPGCIGSDGIGAQNKTVIAPPIAQASMIGGR